MATEEIMWERGEDRKTQGPLLNRKMWQVDPQTERTIHRSMQTRTAKRPAARGRSASAALKSNEKEHNWEMGWQERREEPLAWKREQIQPLQSGATTDCCTRGGLDWIFGSISLQRGWSNIGTGFLERWSMLQAWQCLKGIWTMLLITCFNSVSPEVVRQLN